MSALLKMQNKTFSDVKHKDGDDSSSELLLVNIEPVSNGYLVHWVYDEDEVKEVFTSKEELLRELNSSL